MNLTPKKKPKQNGLFAGVPGTFTRSKSRLSGMPENQAWYGPSWPGTKPQVDRLRCWRKQPVAAGTPLNSDPPWLRNCGMLAEKVIKSIKKLLTQPCVRPVGLSTNTSKSRFFRLSTTHFFPDISSPLGGFFSVGQLLLVLSLKRREGQKITCFPSSSQNLKVSPAFIGFYGQKYTWTGVFDPNKISGVDTKFGLLVHVLPGPNNWRVLKKQVWFWAELEEKIISHAASFVLPILLTNSYFCDSRCPFDKIENPKQMLGRIISRFQTDFWLVDLKRASQPLYFCGLYLICHR